MSPRYHVVGIGGAGMSAIARLLLARGDVVSGSDRGHWPLADALARDGARVATSFDAANVAGADVVVRSSAYGDANPEVAAARAGGSARAARRAGSPGGPRPWRGWRRRRRG